MAKFKSKKKRASLRSGALKNNSRKIDRMKKDSSSKSMGVQLLTKFGIRAVSKGVGDPQAAGTDLKIVMGIALGENSELAGIADVEYILHVEDSAAHLMIGDFAFEYTGEEMAQAIYSRFDYAGELKDAPAMGPLGEWETFNTIEGIIPALKGLGVVFNDERGELDFVKSLTALIDALGQIAFSCFITSGVVLTDGSFKPLLIPSEALPPEASDASNTNADEVERRQSVASVNPG